MDNKKPQKTPGRYCCKKCDYHSRNRKDYTRHLATTKHQWITMDNQKNPRPSSRSFSCACGKNYKFRSGLCKHKKKCRGPSGVADYEMINRLLEQNKTLIERLTNLAETGSVVNYQNCHNKKMTINVFLNEKCKSAMNLTDFLQNLEVSLADLMYTKTHGYIKGISNIFVKSLEGLDPTLRPIHCSDKKRLHFYVKDEDKWERDPGHEKIHQTIQDVTVKQIHSLTEWQKTHPNYLTDEHLLVEWHTMIQQIMGGSGDTARSRNIVKIKKSLGTTTELKDNLVIQVESKPTKSG